jgi:hypothetical protein
MELRTNKRCGFSFRYMSRQLKKHLQRMIEPGSQRGTPDLDSVAPPLPPWDIKAWGALGVYKVRYSFLSAHSRGVSSWRCNESSLSWIQGLRWLPILFVGICSLVEGARGWTSASCNDFLQAFRYTMKCVFLIPLVRRSPCLLPVYELLLIRKRLCTIVLPSRVGVRVKALASSRDSRHALSSAVQMQVSSGGMIDSSFMAHLRRFACSREVFGVVFFARPGRFLRPNQPTWSFRNWQVSVFLATDYAFGPRTNLREVRSTSVLRHLAVELKKQDRRHCHLEIFDSFQVLKYPR